MATVAYEAEFVRQHVNPMARVNWNKIGLRDGWTHATAQTTTDICLWVWKRGYKFATEVRMNNGLRADILVPELYGSQVIEVMDSEGFASINKKSNSYAKSGIECISVPADTEKALAIIRAANNIE